ncbi:hypothetical protein HZA40_01270, partial [Candidatus Peregrinibacteria bacterium]|nr:hypothetical protein [Candidatus Peregrinibacteria bacterium]
MFEPGLDVRWAGVLVALPSLLVNGLLKFSKEHFFLPKGFYGLESLLVIFAFLALLRVKSLEKVQHFDPGELGKLVGLDRIPEVKILREKLKILSQQGSPADWSRELGRFWMEEDPGLAGILYIDGHVRVYHGNQTALPKRYVAREKLCLRGVTDYWVNDSLGNPFFVVTQTVNSGLLSVLEHEIIPRLLEDVPNQPTQEELKVNKNLFRFAIVFDREGFSQIFFKKMLALRIACYTYRKNVKDVWPESEFVETEVIFPNGEKAAMKLAERGLRYPDADIWVREIRKLKESGHQTSLVATDFLSDTARIAGSMFSRWSQENFFKYMMEHYGIDRLIDYQLEKMDDTTKVVNPRHRELESQIRSRSAKLYRRKAEYGALIYGKEIDEKEIQGYVQKKAELIEVIEELEKEIQPLKALKKDTKKHIPFSELPEAEKFKELKKNGKQFSDTIKMIAYRAETALVNVLRSYIPK